MIGSFNSKLDYLTKNLAKKRIELLQSEDTYGACLLGILCDLFGEELLTWSPTTIKMEINSYLGSKLNNAIYNKAMAAITIVTTDFMYQGVPQFLAIARALAGDGADADYSEPVDFDDLCWAIIEADTIWPFPNRDDKGRIILPPEVEKLLTYFQKQEGYQTIPPITNVAIQLPDDSKPEDSVSPDITVLSMSSDKMEELENKLASMKEELKHQIAELPLQNKYDATIKHTLSF